MRENEIKQQLDYPGADWRQCMGHWSGRLAGRLRPECRCECALLFFFVFAFVVGSVVCVCVIVAFVVRCFLVALALTHPTCDLL